MANPFSYSGPSNSVQFFKMEKPGDYVVRVLSILEFKESWIPCVVMDTTTGTFKTEKKRFSFPADGIAETFLAKLGTAEVNARKAIFGAQSRDVWATTVRPKSRYRVCLFDMTPGSKNDPNKFAFVDIGVELKNDLMKLVEQTSKLPGQQDYVQYGPLFGYDVVITRVGTEMTDTKYSVSPLDPTSRPFDKLKSSTVKNPELFNKFISEIDLEPFFSPEQFKAIQEAAPNDAIMAQFKFDTNESTITRLIQEPVDFSYVDKKTGLVFHPKVAEAISNQGKHLIMKYIEQGMQLPPHVTLFLEKGPEQMQEAMNGMEVSAPVTSNTTSIEQPTFTPSADSEELTNF